MDAGTKASTVEDVVLEVYREHRPGVIHVVAAGEMDEAAVTRLREELAALRPLLVRTIVLDLRRSWAVGADALRMVSRGAARAAESGQRVIVVREPGELSGLPPEVDTVDVPLGPEPVRGDHPAVSAQPSGGYLGGTP